MNPFDIPHRKFLGRPNYPLDMAEFEMLVYDPNLYAQYRTDGRDRDSMDWGNTGRKYAANRGVLTNNLEYGESQNPLYGNLMDVISGRKVLRGNPPNINDMDPAPRKIQEENNYSEKMNTAVYPSIAESMLTATLGGSSPRVRKPLSPVTPLPQPVPVKPGVIPAPRPIGPIVVAPVAVTPAIPVGGPVGGGGGGGGSAPADTTGGGDTAGLASPTSTPDWKSWLPVIIGAIVLGLAGYFYAKSKGKSVAMFGIGGAVLGAGAGYGVKKFIEKPADAPAPASGGEEKKFCGCGA